MDDTEDSLPQRLALQDALRAVADAKEELDRVLRAEYPIGVGVVFVKGTQREHGVVVQHGHDGTIDVRLTGAPRKIRKVAAHEIRS